MQILPNSRRLIRVAAIGSGLVLIPLAVAPNEGVAVNDACAGSGCCTNVLAICETDHSDHYGYENKTWGQIIFGCPD